MNENWKKSNKRMMIVAGLMFVFGAVMFVIFFFDMFNFANAMVKGSNIEPEDMRLYGEIFCIFIVIVAIRTFWCKMKEDPEKAFEKSLSRYAKTTENPAATFNQLKKTWENGEQLRDWCRMDEEYIIDCINGPCYANVIPVKDVVWAYKTITRTAGAIKTNATLNVRYANQKSGSISISENTVDYILQLFMKNYQNIVVGHNQEAEKIYLKKDMVGLKEYARQQRLEAEL